MRISFELEEIDRFLNELEQLATDQSSCRRFYLAVLERLRFVLGANAAAIMFSVSDGQWLKLASSGAPIDEEFPTTLGAINSSSSYVLSSDGRCLAIPVRKQQWERSILLIQHTAPHDESNVVDVVKLVEAFAEIVAMRQLAESEDFLNRRWPQFIAETSLLPHANSLEESAYLIVNAVAMATHASRVSIVHAEPPGAAQLLAVSGVANIAPAAQLVTRLEQLCWRAIEERQAFCHYSPNPQDTDTPRDSVEFSNFACLPLTVPFEHEMHCQTAMLLEWTDYEDYLAGIATLNAVLPMLSATWLQGERWSKVPVWVRARVDRNLAQPPRSAWQARLRRFAWVGSGLLLGILALNFPCSFSIPVSGSLEPIEQRVIYAPLDGIVNEIFVADEQPIDRNELLLSMRSPMLEIEFQDVLSEIKANVQKRDVLNLTINQLAGNPENSDTTQSRLSSEIRQLEIQLQTLEEKRDALSQELHKLQVQAPLTGIVMAREIDRFLDSRPVRRGEALFRIVQLDGPWRLQLMVPDKDVGYIQDRFFGPSSTGRGLLADGADAEFEFVITSRPDLRYQATATWLGQAARNPTGEGMFVDLFASVDRIVAQQGYMGATVQASIDCGKQPFWFVWSRPFVEALQRRLWF